MRTVHYMVRKPGVAGEAVYPSELDQPFDYYGVGSFFLSGNQEEVLDVAYSFWAIRQGRAIETKLKRQSRATYIVDVDQIGTFVFKARRVGVPVKYTGSSADFSDKVLIRQLAPSSHELLDRAVRMFDFYFVGFTPKLNLNR